MSVPEVCSHGIVCVEDSVAPVADYHHNLIGSFVANVPSFHRIL